MFISCLHEEHILYIVITRIVKRETKILMRNSVWSSQAYIHYIWCGLGGSDRNLYYKFIF